MKELNLHTLKLLNLNSINGIIIFINICIQISTKSYNHIIQNAELIQFWIPELAVNFEAHPGYLVFMKVSEK